MSLGLTTIDFKSLANLSLIGVFVIAMLAYVIGFILDPVANLWDRIFKPKDLAQVVLDEFTLTHPNLDFKFQGRDWPILLAYLRRDNAGAVTEIERFNVTHIMLRNVSLNLVTLSIIETIQYFRINSVIWHLVLSLALLVLSIIAGQQSAKFSRWFYSANYEAIIAHTLELSDLLVQKKEIPPAPEG